MKLWTSIILTTLTFPFFIGCGSSVKKMTVSDMALENKHQHTVQIEVTGWEKIGKLQTSGLSNERYAQTLTNSIKTTGLFKDVVETGSDYKLKVTVVEHILPAHVGDFDLQLKTNWQLTDNTGKVVWTDTIASVYTSKLIDEVTTFDRLQKANENLTKINIGDGLKKLSQLKL